MRTDRLRIAWLTTGRGPGSFGALEYVVDAIERGLPAQIAVLFVNRERGEYEATDGLLDYAEGKGIPVETLSSVRFRREAGGGRSKPGEPLPQWRYDFDTAVAGRLGRYDFDVAVMFGYMLIATPPLFERFAILNDHPALPDGPVGTYQEVIEQLIRQGAAESGCMMNLVSGDVDRGAVVSYCRYPIRDAANSHLWEGADQIAPDAIRESELFADIRARGVARERPFVAETLRAIAEAQLEVPPPGPADLSDAVERALQQPREA